MRSTLKSLKLLPFIQLNKINLYYEIHGKGGPTVFLSGFSARHTTWLSYVESFKKELQVILLDNRGAGQTTASSPPYTIEIMADDTIALLDYLNIERANFVGSSMGAAITQTIAYKYPNRTNKGVLIAPFHQLPKTSQFKIETIRQLMEANVSIETIIDTVIHWLFSDTFLKAPEKYQEKAKEMAQNPYPQAIQGFEGQFEALKHFDSSPFLSKIQAEMLILAGREDLCSPLWCAQYLYSHLKRATLHIFPNVGHMVHIEKKEEAIALIKEHFLC